MSKFKCNTIKITNFQVVPKIVYNGRLTHTNFYFLKKILKIQKVKCSNFKINQLSYFLKNIKIEVPHEPNTQFSGGPKNTPQ